MFELGVVDGGELFASGGDEVLDAFGGNGGIHDGAEEGEAVDADDFGRQVGIGFGDPEGEKAAEAVADDDGVVEFIFLDVGGKVLADGGEEVVGGDGFGAAEAGEGEGVSLVALFVEMGGGFVPDFGGAAEAGDEDDGFAGAGNFDGEGGAVGGCGGDADDDGESERFHELRVRGKGG